MHKVRHSYNITRCKRQITKTESKSKDHRVNDFILIWLLTMPLCCIIFFNVITPAHPVTNERIGQQELLASSQIWCRWFSYVVIKSKETQFLVWLFSVSAFQISLYQLFSFTEVFSACFFFCLWSTVSYLVNLPSHQMLGLFSHLLPHSHTWFSLLWCAY